MISKELLSEVLGEDVSWIEPSNGNNMRYSLEDSEPHYKGSINIHELAHKCKEWAVPKNFTVGSNITMCDVSVAYIVCEDGEERLFEADTEPEAIFKACEWIKDNK